MERKEYKEIQNKLKEAEQINEFVDRIDACIQTIKDNYKLEIRASQQTGFAKEINPLFDYEKSVVNPKGISGKRKNMKLFGDLIVNKLESEKQKAFNYNSGRISLPELVILFHLIILISVSTLFSKLSMLYMILLLTIISLNIK